MKLQKHNVEFDDAEAAKTLIAHTKRFEGHKFLLGLHCFWIKSQIQHGEFGPWLQQHAPDLCRLKDGQTPQPKTQLANAMKFCAEAGKQAGFSVDQLLENISQIQIPGDRGFANGCESLLLADTALPADAKALKEKLHKGIQLQLDFENGEKKFATAAAPKKLTPTQQHEEHVKNIGAHFDSAEGALAFLVQLKDVDYVTRPPAQREVLGALCRRILDRNKDLKQERAKI